MWGIISSTFLGIYCLISVYIARRGWSVLKASKKIIQRIYWFCFGILVLAFPITEIGQGFIPLINKVWISTCGWYSMLAVVYIFFFLLLADLVQLLDKYLRFVPKVIKHHNRTPLIIGCLILLLVFSTLTYGTYNAQNPVITRYELSVDKSAPSLNQLRVAMISDIHYGKIVDVQRLNKMVNSINELNPDVIVIDGDICDSTVNQQEFQQLLEAFKQLHSKYGVFAVPGNHDRWARDDNQVRLMKEAGVNVLRDQYIKVENSFYMIGRDNPSRRGGGNTEGRKELGDLTKGVDSSLPLILLDHQPLELETAQQNQIDLQLAGHTHEGQIFPGNLITKLVYEIDWGYLKKGNYNLIVSSGYGTWGPPLRIGTHSEIVCATIRFK
ncbi:metallophosphoesterase [Desulfosporosinus sp. Sb-LF]|uniref:metallophosphoesterase n=1 Tax=Desulfosporosinus sp. Sb-LF TaxID=2560027 RepID=UPI00107F9414|nr:metallophosphoesterase [Desulfosporosinus sp. Sb-LF]TGE34523.1 metallophosphoesterase [Desulfosporosinus sp. Sb-LF]